MTTVQYTPPDILLCILALTPPALTSLRFVERHTGHSLTTAAPGFAVFAATAFTLGILSWVPPVTLHFH